MLTVATTVSLLSYTVNVSPFISPAVTPPPTVFVNVIYASVGAGAVYLLCTVTESVSPVVIVLAVSEYV